jgi:hypothetical protein
MTVDWQKQTDLRLAALEKGHAEMTDKLKAAFPGGDHEGHRRYHDELIEQNRIRKDLVKAIREKTVAGLVWAIIVWLGAAIWNEFKRRLGL